MIHRPHAAQRVDAIHVDRFSTVSRRDNLVVDVKADAVARYASCDLDAEGADLSVRDDVIVVRIEHPYPRIGAADADVGDAEGCAGGDDDGFEEAHVLFGPEAVGAQVEEGVGC